MKYHKPYFFDDFHCIGSSCSDTCCAGWEIEVDETTAQGYLQEKGDFGKRLHEELGEEEGEYFFKLKNNRCPFLNRENLCDIFINIGEDRLCDICREHPRFYNWFGDYTEVGIGMCCEEAQRLLFLDSRPLSFIEESTDEDTASDIDMDEKAECEQMLEERDAVFSILQNRKEAFSNRIKSLLSFAMADEKKKDIKQSAIFLIKLFENMEALDETWPSMMNELEENIESILEGEKAFAYYIKDRSFEYEHMAVYMVYRYYPESLFDGLAWVKLLFAAAGVMLLYLLDIMSYQKKKEYTIEDRLTLSRRFSKEIEYCPENMEKFEKCCIKEGANLIQSLEAIADCISI